MREAVDALTQAWRHVETLPQGTDDLRGFQTRKLVAHVISWIHGQVSPVGGFKSTVGGPQLNEPMPGMCSSGQLNEHIRELPASESSAVWLFLARIERLCLSERRVWEVADKFRTQPMPSGFRPIFQMERISQALAMGEVERLPEQVVDLIRDNVNAARELQYALTHDQMGINPEVFQRDDALVGWAAFCSGPNSFR